MTDPHRVSLQPAWILHHYPYRDSSLLLEVFTRDQGRIGVIARGARAARGRRHSQLQILRPLLLSWHMRGELGTLTGAEPRAGLAMPSGRQLLSASYLNELLLRLMSRHDPHPRLFAAYEAALAGLPHAEEDMLRIFEKRLLQELGYGLLLDQEADSGEPVVAEVLYEYHLERGPCRCSGTPGAGLYLHGSSLLGLFREELPGAQARREAKALTRAALARYLGPRPLRSREVLRQLAQLSCGGRQPPAQARESG